MKLTKECYAWAVVVTRRGHSKPRFFSGRYWWWYRESPKIPPNAEGCHWSLFKTRKEAREAAKHTEDNDSETKMVVKKVLVTVKEL